jgi:hypothetical protein
VNTKLVNSAAGVILRALTQNRTAAGIATALESAQLLQPPETAAELARLRAARADEHDELALALGRSNGTEWGDLIEYAAGAVSAEVKLRARVAELEAAAYGDAKVRLLTPVEQIRHLHAAVAAQLARAGTLDRLLREAQARVAELEAGFAESERPADEDPIRYTLTAQAEEDCDHPNGYGPNGCAGCGAFTPADGQDDVTPQVAKLRTLLAGQREQAGGAPC